MAIPGSIVASGKLVTPGGAAGPLGAVGPAGPAGPTAVSTDAGNIATLGSDSKILVPQSSIWSARLRSFNAVGNPNFEVDARVVSGLGNYTAGTISAFQCDRWTISKAAATGAFTSQRANEIIVVPGTSFMITNSRLRVTLTTQQSTLGSTDYISLSQAIEGCVLRELYNDVHSLSLLVRSSVATLKFSVQLIDPGLTTSLVKLCTIPTANVFTLIPLPNLPVFPPAGNFSTSPGIAGATLNICLASGSNLITPAVDTWQSTGNFIGAPGMSNFMASPVNSTFDIAFVQHEPGPVCSTLIDKPFAQNYDECLRYYAKSYPYTVKPGSVDSTGPEFVTPVNSFPYHWIPYPKSLAIPPTGLVGYSSVTGVQNVVRDVNAAVDRGISGVPAYNEKGFSGFSLNSSNPATTNYAFHYTADTGW